MDLDRLLADGWIITLERANGLVRAKACKVICQQLDGWPEVDSIHRCTVSGATIAEALEALGATKML